MKELFNYFLNGMVGFLLMALCGGVVVGAIVGLCELFKAFPTATGTTIVTIGVVVSATYLGWSMKKDYSGDTRFFK